MASSPRTPTRRRKSSCIDLSITSPSTGCNGYTSRKSSVSRRSSLFSMPSPTTPRLVSPHDISGDFSGGNGLGNTTEAANENGNGLGNLADELAEAWDEEGEAEGTSELQHDGFEEKDHHLQDYTHSGRMSFHDRNGGTTHAPISDPASTMALSPPKQPTRSKHRRLASKYDGSDYGEDSDFEDADGISATLEARLAAIESLARRGTESNGSDADTVVKRVADILKDLPSQSGVENGATRLITTHAALTSHLTHQTRTLLALTHPLTSPLSLPPDPETVCTLLPLLADLLSTLPTPNLQTLSALHGLHAATTDLQTTLTYLSDAIYMTRQTMTSGNRKLRTVSETVMEMRREEEVREEAVRWIEKGGWDERLRRRECARVCGEVVGGFEEVCDEWRRRLLGGGGGVGVGVGVA